MPRPTTPSAIEVATDEIRRYRAEQTAMHAVLVRLLERLDARDGAAVWRPLERAVSLEARALEEKLVALASLAAELTTRLAAVSTREESRERYEQAVLEVSAEIRGCISAVESLRLEVYALRRELHGSAARPTPRARELNS